MDQQRRGGIWALGLAGFGTNVGWGLNKVFTAVILGARGAGVPLIGAVLGLQGLFGIILNPVTGFLSDRLETRLGRRRPFLLVGYPGAAVGLILLFFAQSLTVALVAIIAFFFFLQISQAPYLAMMPDSYDSNEYGRAAGNLNVLWMFGGSTDLTVGAKPRTPPWGRGPGFSVWVGDEKRRKKTEEGVVRSSRAVPG